MTFVFAYISHKWSKMAKNSFFGGLPFVKKTKSAPKKNIFRIFGIISAVSLLLHVSFLGIKFESEITDKIGLNLKYIDNMGKGPIGSNNQNQNRNYLVSEIAYKF